MKINTFLIVTISITVIAVLAIANYVQRPLLTSITTTRKDLESKRSELSSLQNKLTSLRRLSENQAQIDKYAKIAEDSIPTDPELGDFMIEMESLLNQAKLRKSDFDVALSSDSSTGSSSTKGSAVILSGMSPIAFSVTGESSYSRFLVLVHMIKRMTRLNTISTVNLSTDTESTTSTAVTFQLSGNIFTRSTTTANKSASIPENPDKLIQDASAKLGSLITYGQPLNIKHETGFGRTNPFLPY